MKGELTALKWAFGFIAALNVAMAARLFGAIWTGRRSETRSSGEGRGAPSRPYGPLPTAAISASERP